MPSAPSALDALRRELEAARDDNVRLRRENVELADMVRRLRRPHRTGSAVMFVAGAAAGVLMSVFVLFALLSRPPF